MLRKFEQELLAKGWEEVHPGVEVKICACPEGGEEPFVLCRSEGRKDKETAVPNRFLGRLEAGLGKLREQTEKGRLRDRQQAERRIGRLLERNSRAASLFTVTVIETGSGKQRRLATKEITRDQYRTKGLMIDYTVNFLNSLSLGLLVFIVLRTLKQYKRKR